MKAIIMAGGEGSRLRPLTCDCPKPMMRLMDRPVMQYALELLRSGYYTVAQAADKSGFSSPYYFSAFVRRHTGRPPTAFVGASSAEK